MKLLSIDVGIKNLSFCLLERESDKLTIVKWDNIDLSEKDSFKCMEIDKHGLCDKPAKFSKNNQCYCLKHSKKHNYLQPTTEFKSSYLNKQTLPKLIEIANKYKITYDGTSVIKKSKLIELINEFSNSYCYTTIDKTNATKVDLVTIGKNIQHKLDEVLGDSLLSIDTIIIENQIGPIANKMKTIQGMISQYFIMKNNDIKIEFISATNKLKDFLPKDSKIDYKQRKQLGIKTCLEFVSSDEQFKEWEPFVVKHKKKDDLSDCFLQGLWYVKHKL